MSENIAICELDEALLNWLAGLFLDRHKKAGYIVCELDRRLPVQGCSIGIATADSDTISAVLNRSPLALDDLTALFQNPGSVAGGMTLCVLKTPPVYNNGFRICLYGEAAVVDAVQRFIQTVLDRVEEKRVTLKACADTSTDLETDDDG